MSAADSTSSVSTTVIRFIFSLIHGTVLFFTLLLIYSMYDEFSFPSILFLMTTLCIASYGVGLVLNAFTQLITCPSVNGPQIALASLFGPMYVWIALFLVWAISWLEYPVLTILPQTLTPLYKKAISRGFYIFWAGMYAQVIASGYTQVC